MIYTKQRKSWEIIRNNNKREERRKHQTKSDEGRGNKCNKNISRRRCHITKREHKQGKILTWTLPTKQREIEKVSEGAIRKRRTQGEIATKPKLVVLKDN